MSSNPNEMQKRLSEQKSMSDTNRMSSVIHSPIGSSSSSSSSCIPYTSIPYSYPVSKNSFSSTRYSSTSSSPSYYSTSTIISSSSHPITSSSSSRMQPVILPTLFKLDLFDLHLSDDQLNMQLKAALDHPNNCISGLDLFGNTVGKSSLKTLAQLFKTNTFLTKLDLIGLNLNDQDLSTLLKAIKENARIPIVEFLIIGNTIGEASIKVLAEWLNTNTSLTVLNLQSLYLSDNYLSLLIKAMTENTNSIIRRLLIGGNDIGEASLKALELLLKTNTSLHFLELKNFSLTDSGLSLLLKAVTANTKSHISELHLHGNTIDKESKEALAQLFQTTRSLTIFPSLLELNHLITVLQVKDSHLPDLDLSKLLQVILEDPHTAITKFDLGGNTIGPLSKKVIFQLLEKKEPIELLGYIAGSFDEEEWEKISELLKIKQKKASAWQLALAPSEEKMQSERKEALPSNPITLQYDNHRSNSSRSNSANSSAVTGRHTPMSID